MGITGLLPFLGEATENTHISRFRGGTVAVDSYCWLHKGANACAEQLVRGDDTDVYVNYCLKYVNMLRGYDIHVIMVFDGHNLPAKSETELKRRESRQKAKLRAAELLRLGRADEARNAMKQAIDVTPRMAHKLIEACRKLGADCIVAPYESDAQLAFFGQNNVADCIITEDSDLVLFGCRKVMYKMDVTGAGQLVSAEKINDCMKLRPDVYTFDKFMFMCILSGCDYLSSLSGIGLKKALKFLGMTAETDPLKFLDKLPRYLNMRHLDVTDEYKENFMIAYATLKHQTVFNPFERRLMPLKDPIECNTDPKYCRNSGAIYDDRRALEVALGNRHPSKDETFGNWSPPESLLPSRSIWSSLYTKNPTRAAESKPKDLVQFGVSKTYKKDVSSPVIKREDSSELDKDMEHELSIYKHSTLIVPPKKEKEEPAAADRGPSPVLGRNPFLKKKISKFARTNTDPGANGGVVTKSRFFNKSNSENIAVATRSEGNSSEGSAQSSQASLTAGIEELEVREAASPPPPRKRSIDNISDITNLDEKVAKIEPSQEVRRTHPKLKKIKLGPAPSVGLRRMPPSGQKTLGHFFARMKSVE